MPKRQPQKKKKPSAKGKPTPKPTPKQRKPTKYHKVLKQFTKLNRQLPEEAQLSYRERIRLTKDIVEGYQDVPIYKLRIKDINGKVVKVIKSLPIKQLCDINFLDLIPYQIIEWFALDETFKDVIPQCINIKVTAGLYGETRIFNTRNYDYVRTGTRDVVESIREDAKDDRSGKYIFSAYKKLKPKKKNDGTPDNYYLDFILQIVKKTGKYTAFGDETEVEYTPKGRGVSAQKKKVQKIIDQRVRKLKNRKDRGRRARKVIEKHLEYLDFVVDKVRAAKKYKRELKMMYDFTLDPLQEHLEKNYANGKVTDKYHAYMSTQIKQRTRFVNSRLKTLKTKAAATTTATKAKVTKKVAKKVAKRVVKKVTKKAAKKK